MESKTINLVFRLFKLLSKERKRSLTLLIPIAIITGLSDVIVVGIVSRLFTAVVGQENKPSIPYSDLITTDPVKKVLILILIYVTFNWFASFLRLILRAFQEKLRSSIFLDLSKKAQEKIFSQKYEYFLTNKSEDISSKILLNISRVSDKLIRPILQILSGFFIVLFIFIAILSFAKITAFYLIIFLVLGYLFISLSVTPIIRKSTRQRIILESEVTKVIQESIRTITDVHLTGSEEYFQDIFSKASKKAFPYLWRGETLPEFPRSLIEPFGITLIFSIGLFPLFSGKSPNNLLEIVPFLATIAVASLKLTPPLQDLFRGITELRSGIPDLEESLTILEMTEKRKYEPSKRNQSFKFPKNSIELKSIFYKYPNSNLYSLSDISLKINIGSKVAFVGKTGSGKTTTANQILCLLNPTSGNILLDNRKLSEENFRDWQYYCSYVPQTINLLNDDLIANVAYGLNKDKIDIQKVWDSLNAAQLKESVENLPQGLRTKVGENGIRLSGGQRQRVALARAFYRNSKLLVLDEATSALDNKTESDLMNAVLKMNRDLTIIIIAHRLSTVKQCDYIYEFDKGKILGKGKYEDLKKESDTFRNMIELGKKYS